MHNPTDLMGTFPPRPARHLAVYARRDVLEVAR
jgi:hypothetical protein